MNSIHSLQRGQACAFDFIQNVLSSINSQMENKIKNEMIQLEQIEVANFYEKNNRNLMAENIARKEILLKRNNTHQNQNQNFTDNQNQMQNKKIESEKTMDNKTTKISEKKSGGKIPLQDNTTSSSTSIPQKTVAVMPEKKWTELPEYRSAYVQALNEGLNGQSARDRTRGLLENVLADVS